MDYKLVEEAGSIAGALALSANYVAKLDYAEHSIDIHKIDQDLGCAKDVVDPLLSCHRLVRAYLLGAGDALYSISKLVYEQQEPLAGMGTLARAAAEHAGLVVHVGDPTIGYEQRIARACGLFVSAIREYQSEDPQVIKRWADFGSRTGINAESKPGYTKLVTDISKDRGLYSRLSRPAHGNAAWLVTMMIHEQQKTGYQTYLLLSLVEAACSLVTFATEQALILRGLDPEEVSLSVDGGELMSWADLRASARYVFDQIEGEFKDRDLTLSDDL